MTAIATDDIFEVITGPIEPIIIMDKFVAGFLDKSDTSHTCVDFTLCEEKTRELYKIKLKLKSVAFNDSHPRQTGFILEGFAHVVNDDEQTQQVIALTLHLEISATK